MKRYYWLAIVGVALLATQASAGERLELKTDKDKMSYAIGADMGTRIKQQGMDLNVDALTRATKDALTGQNLMMSDDEIRKAVAKVQVEQNQKRMQDRRTRAARGAVEANRKVDEGQKSITSK